MSDLWAYNPDKCDGDYCPMNCAYCYKAENYDDDYEEDEDES